MSHSTVVVTGGAGFIGSHIVDALVRRGDQVRIVDNFATGSQDNIRHHGRNVEVIDADIRDAPSLSRAFRGADFVIHQAALASVPLSIERPDLVHDVCATGTLCVLDAARKNNVKRVVYAASSSCYGNAPTAAKRETDELLPLSPYAASKLAGEMYCKAYWESFGLETVSLRYFNVFGPRQDPNSQYSAVIPLFITRVLEGKSLVVFGDGNQSRDFTYVQNIVDANLLALYRAQAAGQVFNVAQGRSATLLQLIAKIEMLLNVKIEPEFAPPRAGDVRDSLADISRAERILGYQPKIGFQEGLEMSIEYYGAAMKRDYPARIRT